MKNRLTIITVCLCMSLISQGQTWNHIKTVGLPEETTNQSMDSDGYLYVGTKSGNILKYDQNGELLETYSDLGKFPVTTVEAWNRMKPFIYYQSAQQFYFLDRFSTTPAMYDLSDFYSGLTTLCAPGFDNSFWVLSANHSELKKFDIQTRRLILENPLQLDLSSASYMRAHRSNLIICDPENGLFYFDQYGNQIAHNPSIKITDFQVSKNDLIYLQSDTVWMVDYTFQTIVKSVKAPEKASMTVYRFGNQYIFVRKDELIYYSLDL
ncbi:MAG: hypothetical protein JXR10_06600 [Cyclobacteriaceae bacterium]